MGRGIQAPAFLLHSKLLSVRENRHIYKEPLDHHPLAYNVTSIQPAAPGKGSLPATGGPSFLLMPTIALMIVGVGVLGATVLRRSR